MKAGKQRSRPSHCGISQATEKRAGRAPPREDRTTIGASADVADRVDRPIAARLGVAED
jgi:hypothetical protein